MGNEGPVAKRIPKPVKGMRALDSLLTEEKHNSYYFVDTNVIIAYAKEEIPILNRYIDVMSLSGCHFFVTRRIAEQFKAALPSNFTLFQDSDADTKAEAAYTEAVKLCNVSTSKYEVDLRWTLESGHCLHTCDQIPFKGEGSVFALTMNTKLVNRFYRPACYRAILERLADEHGLKPLADMRLIHKDGRFEDFPAILPPPPPPIE